MTQVYPAPTPLTARSVAHRYRASYLLTQPTMRVWVLAIGLLIFYFALSPSTMNFGSLNLLTENSLPLAWVAAGQMAVVTAAQIDLSVGSVMSLSTAIAATQMGSSGVDVFGTILVIVLIGAALGAVNGFFVAYRGMSAFIVTIATWSIIDGLALLVLPSAGGAVPNGFANVINTTSPVSFGAIALVVSLLIWMWVRTTAGFMPLRREWELRRSGRRCDGPDGSQRRGVRTWPQLVFRARHCRRHTGRRRAHDWLGFARVNHPRG